MTSDAIPTGTYYHKLEERGTYTHCLEGPASPKCRFHLHNRVESTEEISRDGRHWSNRHELANHVQ